MAWLNGCPSLNNSIHPLNLFRFRFISSIVSFQHFGGLPTASVFAESACIALPWAVAVVQPLGRSLDVFRMFLRISLGHPMVSPKI